MCPDSNPQRRAISRAEKVDTEIKGLLQQLQVYQGELESQNEELQRAQQDLAATLHRYTELYEQAPVGYVTLDARGRITQANRAATQLLQLPKPVEAPIPLTRYVARHNVSMLRTQVRSMRTCGCRSVSISRWTPIHSRCGSC
jgi:PAS domain-containing protein